MQSRIARVFCSAIVVLIANAGKGSAQQEADSNATNPPARISNAQGPNDSSLTVTISEETTYIVEPLRKDGRPDYIAVLDQRFSLGVTPGNNAAVPFWMAVGPDEILEEYRETYFRMLGIPPLPLEGEYFVNIEKYIARKRSAAKSRVAVPEPATMDDIWRQLNATTERPWSEQEFPLFAEWLAANKGPLALVVKASKRPRRYDPLVAGESASLIAVLQPAVFQYRKVTQALCARAMLQLNEGKVGEAWEDLLACHRLARLVGQGPTLIEAVVSLGLCEATCAGDQALLQHTHLTSAQVAKIREDLNRLPELPKMVDKLDIAERFAFLDLVMDFSREDGLNWLAELKTDVGLENPNEPRELGTTIDLLIHYSANTAIDWDYVLGTGNSWFDLIADAYGKPTRAAQKTALRMVDEDFSKLKKTAIEAKTLEKAMLHGPRTALSRRLGQICLICFSPEITTCLHIEERGTMRFELDRLAFALTAYHAELGSYPEKLSDLVPKYAARLPEDFFNEAELRYRQEGDGFFLYSVGPNGQDDGARSYTDRKADEDWDDVVVRVPAARMKGKGWSSH